MATILELLNQAKVYVLTGALTLEGDEKYAAQQLVDKISKAQREGIMDDYDAPNCQNHCHCWFNNDDECCYCNRSPDGDEDDEEDD